MITMHYRISKIHPHDGEIVLERARAMSRLYAFQIKLPGCDQFTMRPSDSFIDAVVERFFDGVPQVAITAVEGNGHEQHQQQECSEKTKVNGTRRFHRPVKK